MEQMMREDQVPTLSSKHPWLVGQNMEQDGDQFFYTVNDPMSHYRCRIPELVGRRIRGCFHGWVILTDHPHDHQWYLWNPVTTKMIRLPHLKLKDGYRDNIRGWCLTSPPDVPGSILILTRVSRPHLVFCRMDRKRKKLRWIEMSYSKQLISITGKDGVIGNPTCCNGKVYFRTSVSYDSKLILQVDIVVKETQDEICLSPLVKSPDSESQGFGVRFFLKGSSVELYGIMLGLTGEKLVDVYVYKLDMNIMKWIKIKDLKDTVFFVDLGFDDSDHCKPLDCSPAICSELGGYVHIIEQTAKVIYSYDMKDKTISMSSMHCVGLPPRSEETNNISRVSVWAMPKFRLQDDDAKCKDDPNKDEGIGGEMVVRSSTVEQKKDEERLKDIPFDVLEMIFKFCIGIENLRFRATCKRCRLAAPLIQLKNNPRLQTYSLDSPWLMVFDKDEGIITFTDPMFGDKYFLKPSPKVFYDNKIWCSRYGWVLLFIDEKRPAFFNPFTNDIRTLPLIDGDLDNFCFSTPPTSPNCMVVGLKASFRSLSIFIHFVGREPSWQRYRKNFGNAGTPIFEFPTFCGQDVYALFNKGGIHVFKEAGHIGFSTKTFVDEDVTQTSFSGEYFHVRCDQHHLLVKVGKFGETLEVFELNETRKEWEKIYNLGRHMIFISDTTCVCMDAKIPEMENKIYFPRLHRDNGKIVFYSLESCKYHTFRERIVEQNITSFFGTKYNAYSRAWIEPTWF